MLRRLLAFSLLILACTSASADLEKVEIPCGARICSHWWPKLEAVKGWHHDRERSLEYRFNYQVPDGERGANGDVAIYASAENRLRMTEKNLQMFIESNEVEFNSKFLGIEIEEVEPLVTADGQRLRSFINSNRNTGFVDRASYGQEGDFFLIFVVSAQSKQALDDEALSVYKQFISTYHSSPPNHSLQGTLRDKAAQRP